MKSGLRSAVMLMALALMMLRVSGAEPVRSIPEALAQVLEQARAAGDDAAALKILQAYTGKPQALLQLACGNAQLHLGQREAAADAYRQALALDPSLREAGLGLAQLAAQREDWAEAVRLLGAHLDVPCASAPALALYAQSAMRSGDARLAMVLTQQGVVRFPADAAFRRLDLALLIVAKRFFEAALAARAALASEPANAELWRQLAYCEQESGHADAALAALEAAWLVGPDRASERRLAEAQLNAAQAPAALAHFRNLLDGAGVTAAADGDAGLLIAAARAAGEAGEVALARTWLDAIPEGRRDRAARVLAARLALEAQDAHAAEAALIPLLSQGEIDPAVLVWAGSLAERNGELDRAEACFRQAASRQIGSVESTPSLASDGAARIACLRLAHLLAVRGRALEARQVLAAYLERHAEDAEARAMLAALPRAEVK